MYKTDKRSNKKRISVRNKQSVSKNLLIMLKIVRLSPGHYFFTHFPAEFLGFVHVRLTELQSLQDFRSNWETNEISLLTDVMEGKFDGRKKAEVPTGPAYLQQRRPDCRLLRSLAGRLPSNCVQSAWLRRLQRILKIDVCLHN